jgi:hypothetical protein
MNHGRLYGAEGQKLPGLSLELYPACVANGNSVCFEYIREHF